jgi:ubiquinone/menaquinone biosynthesis C-methylase UbiE
LAVDYPSVTETVGLRVTAEAVSMMRTRYRLAAERGAGRDVLEVACGDGQGAGLLLRTARRVVIGDYTQALVQAAHAHYRGRIPILRLDAQALPFRAGSFDVVILFEALYYLARPEQFLADCWRVLRPDGEVLICSANPDRSAFNSSPFSTRYYTAAELKQLLEANSFSATLFAAFPERTATARGRLVGRVRRFAVALHLIPRSMRGKELLKRLFYGQLTRLPPELVDEGPVEELVPLQPPWTAAGYKVIYALARRT